MSNEVLVVLELMVYIYSKSHCRPQQSRHPKTPDPCSLIPGSKKIGRGVQDTGFIKTNSFTGGVEAFRSSGFCLVQILRKMRKVHWRRSCYHSIPTK